MKVKKAGKRKYGEHIGSRPTRGAPKFTESGGKKNGKNGKKKAKK